MFAFHTIEEDPIKALTGKIKKMNNELTPLQATIDQKEGELDTLKKRLAREKAALKAAEKELKELQAKADAEAKAKADAEEAK